MKIGAVFPQLEIGADPAVVRDWATTVEEAGYTHVLAYDHVLGADPGEPARLDRIHRQVLVSRGFRAVRVHGGDHDRGSSW